MSQYCILTNRGKQEKYRNTVASTPTTKIRIDDLKQLLQESKTEPETVRSPTITE